MAKVTLAPFIQSISGKVGDLQFRTLKSGRTVVHARNNQSNTRTSPLKPAEIAQRRKFGIVSSLVSEIQAQYQRIDQAAKNRKKIWERVSYAYDKTIANCPDISDKEIKERIMAYYQIRFSDTETWF